MHPRVCNMYAVLAVDGMRYAGDSYVILALLCCYGQTPFLCPVLLLWTFAEVEFEVNLRSTVSRIVCPGVRRPFGTRDQFFFLFEISFRQLRLCYLVAPSLTRGRVCNLLVQLVLGLARPVTLESKTRRTHGHILLSHLRLPQPGGPGSRIYNCWAAVVVLYKACVLLPSV
jgi:hypothetical protein